LDGHTRLKQDKINNDGKYDNNVFLKIYEENVYPKLLDNATDQNKIILEKIKKHLL